MIELNKLVYANAELAEMDVEAVVNVGFLERMGFECCSRRALLIELMIGAFELCRRR